MFTSKTLDIMDSMVSYLLEPVIIALLALIALALWETGLAIGERTGGLRRMIERGNARALGARAQRRIDRADLIARIGPMMGLMGTLIPSAPASQHSVAANSTSSPKPSPSPSTPPSSACSPASSALCSDAHAGAGMMARWPNWRRPKHERPQYRRSRFDVTDEDPMGPLANMADIMLVFAVGLMVALAASERSDNPMQSGVDVEAGREMPELPKGRRRIRRRLPAHGPGLPGPGNRAHDPHRQRAITP